MQPSPASSLRALACCLAIAACAPGAPRPDAPSGVLLVSIDSLRADHLGCYGYASATRPEIGTSPVIDRRLAAEGALFETVVSTTSWTLPSHMALLTGLPDEIHGVLDLPDRLHPSQPLVAEILRDAGWRTAGFWSGPNLDPFFGFGRGFEVYADCSSTADYDASVFDVDLALDKEDHGSEGFHELEELHRSSHTGVTGPRLVEAFRDWFGGVATDERFFAFVHMWDVHYDYVPPAEFDVFDPGYDGAIDGEDFEHLVIPEPETPEEREQWREDVLHLIALYDGEIRFTDHNVGLLLDELAARGRLDDTLVVLTADHGEEFLEHGMLGHKKTLYEESVRIPLLLRWPARIPPGRRVEELASIVDVAPTILDLAGIDPPEGAAAMWGRSLVPAIDGALPPRHAPLELTARRAESEMRGLRAADHKAIRLPGKRRDRIVVFDLAEDPWERAGRGRRRLGDDHPRIDGAESFWAELDRAAARRERAESAALPDDLRRALEDAGYLEPGEGIEGPDGTEENAAGERP